MSLIELPSRESTIMAWNGVPVSRPPEAPREPKAEPTPVLVSLEPERFTMPVLVEPPVITEPPKPERGLATLFIGVILGSPGLYLTLPPGSPGAPYSGYGCLLLSAFIIIYGLDLEFSFRRRLTQRSEAIRLMTEARDSKVAELKSQHESEVAKRENGVAEARARNQQRKEEFENTLATVRLRDADKEMQYKLELETWRPVHEKWQNERQAELKGLQAAYDYINQNAESWYEGCSRVGQQNCY